MLRPADLLDDVRRIARAAGELILRHYATKAPARMKRDLTPVTIADEESEALIVPALQALLPGVPVVAEEAVASGRLREQGDGTRRFWLVDPLDGTKEFLSRTGEFTVNIALVEQRAPVLGIVHAPALNLSYAAVTGGKATVEHADGSMQPIASRPMPAEGAVVLTSRSHGHGVDLDAFLATQQVARRLFLGSALKFCRLAEGASDLYPRFGRTMEWDTAAGQIILEAAGGTVTTLDGVPLTYGKPGFSNPSFLARGRGANG